MALTWFLCWAPWPVPDSATMFIISDLHIMTAAGRVVVGGQVEGAFVANFYKGPPETGDPSAGLLFVRFPHRGEGRG